MSINNKIVENFNDFCNKVKSLYQDDNSVLEILDKALNFTDDEKVILVKNLYDKFTLVPNASEYLKNKKVKLFSSKEEETHQLSLSLFGQGLTLKHIFNSLEGEIKTYLWTSLQVLIHYNKPVETKKIKNNILNMEVDDNINEMITDITNEIKNNMGNIQNGKENMMETIMGVTTKMSQKYKDKITSGEIKLESLVDDLQTKMPNIKNLMDSLINKNSQKEQVKKEPVIIDDDFSTEKVTVGEDKPVDNSINLSKMLPMLQGFSGSGGSGGSGGFGDIEGFIKNTLGDNFGDMMSDMEGLDPEKLKEMQDKMTPEQLKEIKDKTENMMKNAFNIDLSKTNL